MWMTSSWNEWRGSDQTIRPLCCDEIIFFLFSPACNPETARSLGFEVVEESFIWEYKANAVLYKHTKTGAEIMSLSAADENKVFGIVFRTPPSVPTLPFL